EGGERTAFVQVNLGMVAEAAFHGPARIVVLDAIADERGEFAAVELHGDFNLHLAARNDEEPPHVVGQIEMIGRSIEIQPRGVEGAHDGSRRGSEQITGELSRESYLWLN